MDIKTRCLGMLSFGTIVSLWNQYINVFNADIVNEDISQNRTESMQMSKRTLIHEDNYCDWRSCTKRGYKKCSLCHCDLCVDHTNIVLNIRDMNNSTYHNTASYVFCDICAMEPIYKLADTVKRVIDENRCTE